MVDRVYIDSNPMSAADELAQMRRQAAKPDLSAVRVMDYTNNNHHRVELRTGSSPASQPVHGSTGDISGPNMGRGVIAYNPSDPEMVTVDGVQMRRDYAQSIGLIPPSQPGQSAAPFGGVSAEQPQPQSEPQEQEQQEQSSAVEDQGQKALDELAQGFQGDAFAVATEAAESGDFTAIAQDYGLDMAKVEQIVAGAVAGADRIIEASGITTDIMSEVLDDAELAEARRAVVAGDKDHLRRIADKAVNQLATWPSRDAEGFKVWFTANVDGKYEIASDGTFLVHTPRGLMPFGTVVRLGGLRKN